VVEKLMKDDPNFNVEEHFYNNRDRFLYPFYSLNLDQFKDCGILENEQPKN
jgi:hypothetical protein